MPSAIEEDSTLLVSGWAWLPSHLLDLILDKLIPMSDHIRFSAVCKQWQSVLLHQKQQRLKPRHKQLPMLMIPSKQNNKERRGLYCVTQGKPYIFELHFPNNLRCCGSSHGWLACVTTEDTNLVVILLNPFTGHTIRLPSVLKEPSDNGLDPDQCISKVVLSADPGLFPNDYEALVIFVHSGDKLAHFRSGDDAWTTEVDKKLKFSDLIYYKRQFLAVSSDAGVFSVKISSDSITKLQIDLVVEPVQTYQYAHLVESSRGDLLLIGMMQITDYISYTIDKFFEVFKLHCASGDRPGFAEELEGIGNNAVFMGDRESICVSTLDFPECQPNCIYFSTNDWAPPPKDYTRGPFTMTVFKFNLENKTMEAQYYCDPPSQKNPPSIWILPTMV